MKYMVNNKTIDKVKLNELIRMNARRGKDEVVAIASNFALNRAKRHYSLFSYQRTDADTARKKLIGWAKENSYNVEFNQGENVYTVRVLSVTLTVDKNVCIIKELKRYHNKVLSNFDLRNTNIEQLEAYITNMPELFKTIKEGEHYIRENFESEIDKMRKRLKICSLRQSGIETLIRHELDTYGYEYKISKNSSRVVVVIDTGNNQIDFQIANSKVTKMDEVIQELRNLMATV